MTPDPGYRDRRDADERRGICPDCGTFRWGSPVCPLCEPDEYARRHRRDPYGYDAYHEALTREEEERDAYRRDGDAPAE